MSGFGGYNPLPLRLGGDDVEGWRAEQHSRMVADVAAAKRTLPFAVVTVSRAAANGSAPVIERLGCQAAPNSDNAPTATGNAAVSPVPIVLTWPNAPEDELGNALPLQITAVRVQWQGGSIIHDAEATSPNTVSITCDTAGTWLFTVYVYATWGATPKIEHYGGDPSKTDATEELVPYAWIWYRELGSALGSAYTGSRSGSIHARTLALARATAAVSRSTERLVCNGNPATADAMLTKWAEAIQIPIGQNDPNWLVRRRAASMFAASDGQTITGLELALYDLLGPTFVTIRTFDEDDEPDAWPSYWDLGGGVWASKRAKILVDVRAPGSTNDIEFNETMQVHFVRLMDRLTPATTWFDWTITSGGGFYLDVSQLDYTGL